jgi:hypothetical protein
MLYGTFREARRRSTRCSFFEGQNTPSVIPRGAIFLNFEQVQCAKARGHQLTLGPQQGVLGGEHGCCIVARL